MALNSQLLKFKAPGTKILTEIVSNIPQTTMPDGSRILVINSRKGRVNDLVRKDSYAEYLEEFDGINDADERRGNWSARSAEIMLNLAPCYILNLRPFDNALDKAGYQELSNSLGTDNGLAKEKPYSTLFNTAQFWKIDPNALLNSQNVDRLLVFGNLGTKNLSVFVRKTRTVQSNVTFDTWYKNLGKEMPAYVNPLDEVSSWYIDVVIFNNTFATGANSNISYGHLFNEDGTVKKEAVNASGVSEDALEQLTRIPETGYVGTITGSLVQGFVNDRNQSEDIIDLINAMNPQTGLLAARNENIFDAAAVWYEGDTPNANEMKKPVPVDFKGHNLCNINEVGSFAVSSVPSIVNTASYKYHTSVSDVVKNTKTNADTVTFTDVPDATGKFTVTPYKAYFKGNKVDTNIVVTDRSKLYVFGDTNKPSISGNFVGFDGNLAAVTGIIMKGSGTVIKNVNTFDLVLQPVGEYVSDDGEGEYKYPKPGSAMPMDSNRLYFVYPTGHALAGKPICFDTTGKGIYHLPSDTDNFVLDPRSGMTVVEMKAFITGLSEYVSSDDIIKASDYAMDKFDADTLAEIVQNFGSPNNIYEISFDKNLAVNTSESDEDTTVTFDPKVYSAPNNMFINMNGQDEYVYDSGVVFEILIPDLDTKIFNPINLKAYKARNAQFLDGSADRQGKILNMLLDKNIKDALSNRDLTTWNYIVDGFKSYIEPNVKGQLKEVAKNRILARAIYNMPSIFDFSRSTNPYFSQDIGGTFEPRYITTGGNLELPHNNTFSLPSESGWFAYGFGPNLNLSGSTKTMPPAAAVSNLFQNKYLIGKPYMILAGPDQGAIRISGVSGVEYVFNETNDGKGDRDYLDPFGYNVIVNKRSGLQIYGNKTSNNTVNTPVSSIHTSEVLMYIQQRINLMLENFVFAINNSQNRMVIVKQANDICEEPLGAGAISGYRNQMDNINNTSEVIANRIGILDTVLYDANGMEILVHRTKFDSVTNMAEFSVLRSNI